MGELARNNEPQARFTWPPADFDERISGFIAEQKEREEAIADIRAAQSEIMAQLAELAAHQDGSPAVKSALQLQLGLIEGVLSSGGTTAALSDLKAIAHNAQLAISGAKALDTAAGSETRSDEYDTIRDYIAAQDKWMSGIADSIGFDRTGFTSLRDEYLAEAAQARKEGREDDALLAEHKAILAQQAEVDAILDSPNLPDDDPRRDQLEQEQKRLAELRRRNEEALLELRTTQARDTAVAELKLQGIDPNSEQGQRIVQEQVQAAQTKTREDLVKAHEEVSEELAVINEHIMAVNTKAVAASEAHPTRPENNNAIAVEEPTDLFLDLVIDTPITDVCTNDTIELSTLNLGELAPTGQHTTENGCLTV